MTITICDLVADLVRHADANVEPRLEAQVEELLAAQCMNPVIGRWLDQYGIDYLSAIFDLDDDIYAQRFPAAPDIGRARRQRMVSEFNTHLEHCKHCSLKRGYELELDARIALVLRHNKDFLLQHLEEEVDVAEGEHLSQHSAVSVSSSPVNLHFEPSVLLNLLADSAPEPIEVG